MPAAEERLRAMRDAREEEEAETVVLAATDPANPYGAALDWPQPLADARRRARGVARPQRAELAMRLPQQLGQMLRPRQLNATRRSWPQASQ